MAVGAADACRVASSCEVSFRGQAETSIGEATEINEPIPRPSFFGGGFASGETGLFCGIWTIEHIIDESDVPRETTEKCKRGSSVCCQTQNFPFPVEQALSYSVNTTTS